MPGLDSEVDSPEVDAMSASSPGRVPGRPGIGVRVRRTVALGCVLMALAGCSGSVAPSRTPASETPPTGFTPLAVDDRMALLHVPDDLLPGPTAVVMALHGYTSDAAEVVEYFRLRELADERGFVVVAPQGTTDADGERFWNASRACCDFDGSEVDDSAHLDRVLEVVAEIVPVEEARVFVVGHSNGAFMAHRLVCDHADRVAAIAAVAGGFDTDATCAPARPVSVLQVHGVADDSILFEGGAINGRPYTSARQTIGRWAGADGCPAEATEGAAFDADAAVPGDDVTPQVWGPCRDGTAVALWAIEGGGHVPALTDTVTASLVDWLAEHARRA